MAWAPTCEQTQAQSELRFQLLRLTLIGTAVAALGWLLGVAGGLLHSPTAPWDGIAVLTLCGGCAWLMRRGQWGLSLAASFYLAGITQPVCLAGQALGVASPVNAAFTLGLVLCGLLIGGWFLSSWTLGYCAWMGALAWGELHGAWGPPDAIHDPVQMLRLLIGWWGLLIATGGAVWLFARNLERSATVAQGQTAALAGTLNAMTTETDLDQLMGRVIGIVAQQLGGKWATLWLHDPPADTMAVHLTFGEGRIYHPAELPTPAARGAVPAVELPIWGEVAGTRRPLVITDIAGDPRIKFKAAALAEGLKTVLYLPLLLGESAIGMLTVNSQERRRYSRADLDLAQALVQQLTLAIQLARLGQSARDAAVLDERNRLAREIHDTLAQGFTGIVVQLEAAEDILGDNPTAARAHLDRARLLARSSLTEARRSVQALRPQALESEDLVHALARAADNLTAGTPTHAEVHIYGPPRPLPPDTESALLRIGQEALTNALRYAAAAHIRLGLTFHPAGVALQVEDDGQGFDPRACTRTPGFGLIGMRERAARLGGTLTVTSRPGAGTTILAEMPTREV